MLVPLPWLKRSWSKYAFVFGGSWATSENSTKRTTASSKWLDRVPTRSQEDVSWM